MQHQSLRQRIVTLSLVKSLGRSHVTNSSCYQRRIVNKRIYPGVWSKDCLFLLIGKAAAMIHILSSSIDSQRWYKPVTVTIDASNFAEAILNVIVCHHSHPGYCQERLFLAFYPLKTCHCYIIFQMLVATILPHFNWKAVALPKVK